MSVVSTLSRVHETRKLKKEGKQAHLMQAKQGGEQGEQGECESTCGDRLRAAYGSSLASDRSIPTCTHTFSLSLCAPWVD